MELIESIQFNQYLPIVGPDGLFPRRNPLLYKSERIKSMDLVDILSLLNQDVTEKKCSYISKSLIKVDMDKEVIMSLLPKTDIKMVEIYTESTYYSFSKKKYKEMSKENKSYLFFNDNRYEDYATLLYLLVSDQIEDENINTTIAEGICYGYPKDYIKGFYITRSPPVLNLYSCIQGRTVTKKEKTLLYEELNEFLESDLYLEKSNQFEEDYSETINSIEKIFDSASFDKQVDKLQELVQVSAPDYFLG